MQETIDLFKLALEYSSPAFIFLAILTAITFKAKSILYSFIEIKDLSKKRLIQKYETLSNFTEKSFLQSPLKENYQRLCEESQIHALIGCQYCSKDIANFILSRKDINNALNTYHRVKNEIIVKNSVVTPKHKFGKFRINFNLFFGNIFYITLSILAFLPLLFPSLSIIFNTPLNINFNLDIFIGLTLYIISIFSFALFLLNESFKPKLAKIFCELP